MIGSLHPVGPRRERRRPRRSWGFRAPSLAGQRHAAGVLAALVDFHKGRRGRKGCRARREVRRLTRRSCLLGASLRVVQVLLRLPAVWPWPMTPPPRADLASGCDCARRVPGRSWRARTPGGVSQGSSAGVGAPGMARSTSLDGASENVAGAAPEPEDAEDVDPHARAAATEEKSGEPS